MLAFQDTWLDGSGQHTGMGRLVIVRDGVTQTIIIVEESPGVWVARLSEAPTPSGRTLALAALPTGNESAAVVEAFCRSSGYTPPEVA